MHGHLISTQLESKVGETKETILASYIQSRNTMANYALNNFASVKQSLKNLI